MSDDVGARWAGLVIGFIIGLFAGGGIMNSDWKADMIERGYGG